MQLKLAHPQNCMAANVASWSMVKPQRDSWVLPAPRRTPPPELHTHIVNLFGQGAQRKQTKFRLSGITTSRTGQHNVCEMLPFASPCPWGSVCFLPLPPAFNKILFALWKFSFFFPFLFFSVLPRVQRCSSR